MPRGPTGEAERATVELHGAAFVLLPRTHAAGPDGVVLRVTVPDVGAVRQAAQRIGAVEEGAGAVAPTEGAFRVRDPDGHVLEFAKERKRAPPRPRRAVRKKRKRKRGGR